MEKNRIYDILLPMEGIFMKKDYRKFEIFSIAACFIAAAMFVFSVFFSYKSAENVSHRIILSDFQVPSVPADDCNFQSNICKNALLVINSLKNEKTSNPPLNRINAALFNRSFSEIIVIYRTPYCPVDNSVFQKYLKTAMPVRAGPLAG